LPVEQHHKIGKRHAMCRNLAIFLKSCFLKNFWLLFFHKIIEFVTNPRKKAQHFGSITKLKERTLLWAANKSEVRMEGGSQAWCNYYD
jgi:hypothetical protein